MDKERLEYLKSSFYGWEYCVENGLQPTITQEEIDILSNVFIHYEKQQKEIERLRADVQFHKGYAERFSDDNKRLLEALEFYENEKNYVRKRHELLGELDSSVDFDQGDKARQALGEKSK